MARRERKRVRRKKQEVELDINSLLDILVILLVFLLKSYNASDLVLDVKKDISIPQSRSKKLGHLGINVQVAKSGKIWVDNKLLDDADSFARSNIEKSSGKIISLYNKLVTIKETLKKENKKEIKINLVLDQDVKYSRMKKIMHTSGLAGYNQFKFIVIANN